MCFPWKCKVELHVWWQRLCFLHEVGRVWSSVSRGQRSRDDGWTWPIWELLWRQEADCRWKVIFPEVTWPFFNPNGNPQKHQLFCLQCGIAFAGSDEEGRSSWRPDVPEAKSAPWLLSHMGFFLTTPPHSPFLFFPNIFLSSFLLIIFLVYIWNLLVTNRTEFVLDSRLTCFMNYFRSNPIKVNVSTVENSLWIGHLALK